MRWANRRLLTRVLCIALVLCTAPTLPFIGGHTAQASSSCDCSTEQANYDTAVAKELDTGREYHKAQRALDLAWNDLNIKQLLLDIAEKNLETTGVALTQATKDLTDAERNVIILAAAATVAAAAAMQACRPWFSWTPVCKVAAAAAAVAVAAAAYAVSVRNKAKTRAGIAADNFIKAKKVRDTAEFNRDTAQMSVDHWGPICAAAKLEYDAAVEDRKAKKALLDACRENCP